ncbi:hypothetical protein AB6A40_011091 [Gnathostoma spinigerum]|uniref:Uncharacterized protein n=1 Tax=Gnathostoma spinigerum TaxID=75299 RepID=A0ABD6F3W8_9BILA
MFTAGDAVPSDRSTQSLVCDDKSSSSSSSPSLSSPSSSMSSSSSFVHLDYLSSFHGPQHCITACNSQGSSPRSLQRPLAEVSSGRHKEGFVSKSKDDSLSVNPWWKKHSTTSLANSMQLTRSEKYCLGFGSKLMLTKPNKFSGDRDEKRYDTHGYCIDHRDACNFCQDHFTGRTQRLNQATSFRNSYFSFLGSCDSLHGEQNMLGTSHLSPQWSERELNQQLSKESICCISQQHPIYTSETESVANFIEFDGRVYVCSQMNVSKLEFSSFREIGHSSCSCMLSESLSMKMKLSTKAKREQSMVEVSVSLEKLQQKEIDEDEERLILPSPAMLNYMMSKVQSRP